MVNPRDGIDQKQSAVPPRAYRLKKTLLASSGQSQDQSSGHIAVMLQSYRCLRHHPRQLFLSSDGSGLPIARLAECNTDAIR